MKIFLQKYCNNSSNFNAIDSVLLNNLSTVSSDSIDVFFNKTKFLRDPLSYPLLNESIDFRYEIFNHFSDLKFNIKNNLNECEIKYLYKFIREKSFKVMDTDKNVGLAIISNDLYDSLIFSHLNNCNTYSVVNNFNLDDIIFKINDLLLDLKISKSISSDIYNRILINDYSKKIGKFRILAKLHKQKFGLRPIINCKNNFTSRISLLIDLILKPLVKQMPSYLQDSQHLLQDALKLNLSNYNIKDISLISADFESLYTNIILPHALDTITEYVSKKFHSKHINIFAFHALLKIVLFNNYFKYKDCIYLQEIGIGMGLICGPSVANIYVFILEDKALCIHRPIYYKRYIDDIFKIISKNYPLDLFSNSFHNLKLNIVSDKTVPFLDLNISINNITKSLDFFLYTKPTNTFGYLLTSSNHPDFIFDNIPKNLFIRLRRICTDITKYFISSSDLIKQLVSRGYNYFILIKIRNLVATFKREDLIPYKSKNCNKFSADSFLFKMPFDFNFINLEIVFNQCFYNLFKNDSSLNNCNLKILFSKQPSIRDIFVHNASINNNKTFYFSKCNSNNCNVCSVASSFHYINLNGFFLPMISYSNCHTKEAIYIIRCKLCKDTFYIGETSNARVRIQRHINDIINFVPFYIYTCVSNHFNLAIHNNYNLLDIFEFFIFETENLETKEKRLNQENKLVHLFLSLKMKLLNDYIHNKYAIKYHI